MRTIEVYSITLILGVLSIFIYLNLTLQIPISNFSSQHQVSVNSKKTTEEFCFSNQRKNVPKKVLDVLTSLQLNNCTSTFTIAQLHRESQGFGVQFVSYYSLLSLSIKQQKTFFLDGVTWNYGSFQSCDYPYLSSPFECFFKKITSCKLDEEITKYSAQYGVMLGRSVLFYDPTAVVRNPLNMLSINELLQAPSWIEEGPRWWEGHLANAMFCLRDSIIDRAEEIKKHIGWKFPMIGMHIRRGDRKELHKYGLKDYIEKAREAKRRYNTSTIFLATYEEEIINETKNYQNEFEFLHLDWENLSEMKNYKWNKEASSESTTKMLLEIHLLGECNIFVGAQRSMFGWLASRLIIGRENELGCPLWVGNDVSNKYGYWNASKAMIEDGECV